MSLQRLVRQVILQTFRVLLLRRVWRDRRAAQVRGRGGGRRGRCQEESGGRDEGNRQKCLFYKGE